jgi:hypothetical protein
MSRPTATERAQAEATHIKAVSTYAEIGLAVEMIDALIGREHVRFGANSDVWAQLMEVSQHLVQAHHDAEKRARS